MNTKINRINPEKLHQTPGYHHITVVDSGPVAHLSGQCPLAPSGDLVGDGDLDAQIDQVVANTLAALAELDAQPEDVVRSVIYVVGTESETLAGAWHRLNASAIGGAFSTASTLLGVTVLGYSGQLIEVDLTVALPG
ncbi:RidA family protein [Streptomyces sp. NPDC014894]|uniref:RidA family protein n=1 Tax=Streptomyces sp. NPDC014894 TaxID=3364931 RepID=UPI0036F67E6A